MLTGSAGADWFLVYVDGDNWTVKDWVTGQWNSEFVDDLDFINGCIGREVQLEVKVAVKAVRLPNSNCNR
jgi:hypothetical protein